jgi:tetratricopeptide (TPR) repeat protein/predicted aspartyl protease
MQCAAWFRVAYWVGLLLLFVPAAANAAEHCTLQALADVPVSLDGARPLIGAKINGADVQFVLDSGAFWSTLSTAAAAQYGLNLDRSKASGMYIRGLGGNVSPSVTTVKAFTIFNVVVHNADFIVTGSAFGNGAVGLLGQNILRLADIEYDLAHGRIRFFKSKHCEKVDLAYWVKPGESYSMMTIEPGSVADPHIKGSAEISGAKIRVLFDTGTSTSMLSVRAAKRAGITPESPGVTSGGEETGLGRGQFPTWVATFPSFRIGAEEIRNARLRFAEIPLAIDTDMLLGADFFLSHRIYIANDSHKLFFTYSGGPVFDLRPHSATTAPSSDTAAAPAATDVPPPAGSTADPTATGTTASGTREEPLDAAGFAHRAGIRAARSDPDGALADWNQACRLAPSEAGYFFQRGRVHAQRQEDELALKDLEETLRLQPNHLDALLVRTQTELSAKHIDAALKDLERADQAAPKEADIRLAVANLYMLADHPDLAVGQFSQWIDTHRDDGQLAQAYNGRCWARALSGSDLDLALKDCNAALRLRPKAPAFLDSRGLVYLRMGKYDKAIEDYDASLKQWPKNAWSLYGRGIAKLRKGLTVEGQKDIEAAMAAQPIAVESAQRYGIVP